MAACLTALRLSQHIRAIPEMNTTLTQTMGHTISMQTMGGGGGGGGWGE